MKTRKSAAWYLAEAERCFRLAKAIANPAASAFLEELGRQHLDNAQREMEHERKRGLQGDVGESDDDEPAGGIIDADLTPSAALSAAP